MQPVAVEDFYRHMSDLGLRYGEEFRPIRELSAGNGAVGRQSFFVRCYCAPRERVCTASRSLRRSAADFFCRGGDG